MIINKTSWHYRLLSMWDCKIPRSLCPYFWKTLFMSIWTVFVACFVIVIFIAIVYGLGFAILYSNHVDVDMRNLFNLSLIDHLKCVGMSLAVDVGITFCVLMFFFVFVRDFRELVNERVYDSKLMANVRKHEDYYEYTLSKNKQKRIKKSNLLIEFLKAKKEKVCPTLEFK